MRHRGWILAGCLLAGCSALAGAHLGGALVRGELAWASVLTGCSCMAFLLSVGCWGKAEGTW
jgi:hypothetical protein